MPRSRAGWNSGDLFRYDSRNDSWKRWHLPGDRPQPYAVYVDFYVGAFDREAELQPMRHVFPEERLPWLYTGNS
jgi:streptogramin lyase